MKYFLRRFNLLLPLIQEGLLIITSKSIFKQSDNSVDQLASQNPDNLDLNCFQNKIYSTLISMVWDNSDIPYGLNTTMDSNAE